MENRQSGWKRKRERNCLDLFSNFFLPRALSCSCCNFSWSPCDAQVVLWGRLSPIPRLSSLSLPILLCAIFASPHSDIQSLFDWLITLSSSTHDSTSRHGVGHVTTTGASQQPIFTMARVADDEHKLIPSCCNHISSYMGLTGMLTNMQGPKPHGRNKRILEK